MRPIKAIPAPPPGSPLPTTINRPTRIDNLATTDHQPIIPPLLFLIGQLIVLGVGAARIELTARSGDLPQHLALPEMIAFQLAIASMSFSTVITLPTIAGSIVFLHLMGLLTETSTLAEVWTVAIVLLWMIALRQLSELVTDRTTRAIFSSILSAFVVGVPIASYLVSDFSDAHLPRIDPISIAIIQSTIDRPTLSTTALFIASGIAAIFFTLQIRRRLRA